MNSLLSSAEYRSVVKWGLRAREWKTGNGKPDPSADTSARPVLRHVRRRPPECGSLLRRVEASGVREASGRRRKFETGQQQYTIPPLPRVHPWLRDKSVGR